MKNAVYLGAAENQGGAISQFKQAARCLTEIALSATGGGAALQAGLLIMSAGAFAARHAFPTCYILMIWENRYQS